MAFPEETDVNMTAGVLRTASRNILADEVYEILRDSLVAGRIEPGSRLNLDALAREMHVSNTPVRQALARLESEGLVQKEAYRGFSVSMLMDSRTIAELYDYRLLMEPPTTARAAQHADEHDLSGLAHLCEPKKISALIAADATSELTDRDLAFHLAIATLGGNRIVVDHLRLLMTKVRQYSIYHQHRAGELAWDEHRSILTAITDGDARAAAAAMAKHLTTALDRFEAATHSTPHP